MLEQLEQFITWATVNQWRIETPRQGVHALPEAVFRRYPFPKEYRQFLSRISTCVNPGSTKWFICANDFGAKPQSHFRWNEFEIISLDAAKDDAEWMAAIRRSWDSHLPFIMAVDGDYEYFAFGLTDGNIVFGMGPEFEDTRIVAQDFGEFLA